MWGEEMRYAAVEIPGPSQSSVAAALCHRSPKYFAVRDGVDLLRAGTRRGKAAIEMEHEIYSASRPSAGKLRHNFRGPARWRNPRNRKKL
jgi:hypothetical protein